MEWTKDEMKEDENKNFLPHKKTINKTKSNQQESEKKWLDNKRRRLEHNIANKEKKILSYKGD